MAEQPTPNLPTLQIVAAALIASVGIYGAVPFFVPVDAEPPPAAVELVFPIAAGFTACVAFVLRKVMLGTFALAFSAEASPKVGPRSAEEAHLAALRRYFTATIVSLALTEAVAIFGLVLALLAGEPGRVIPFVGVAAVLMAFQFPTQAGLSQVLAQGPREG